jgi:hypothetical protein
VSRGGERRSTAREEASKERNKVKVELLICMRFTPIL